MFNLLFQSEEDIPVSEINEICELLCFVVSSDVDKKDVKEFVNLCIQKRFWVQIARLICAWAQKGPQITWVVETATSHLENVGFWYEEVAKQIYGAGVGAPLQARFIFGQLGVSLLMEASSKKQYGSAFDVLLVLHRYNINYVDYQAPMYHAACYIKAVPSPTKIFVFPFTVAFTALDICLQLERPKDAFMIFQSFSLDLPKEFDESLKLEIRSRRFYYLLEIALALQSKDPLGKGIDAFRSLLSTAQKDFDLEQLSEYSKDVQVAYNNYMECILNAQDENLIKEFYAYSDGPQKELCTLNWQVLRGFIVFFSRHNMLDEANKLFHLGCLKNIYELKKPPAMTPPWQMAVHRDWTSEEMKLAFLRFAETLTPILISKKKSDGFDKWFSVQVLIKTVSKVDYTVDCLNNSISALKRVFEAFRALKIQWRIGKKQQSVHLVPESFYNFWFAKFAVFSEPASIFMVPGNVRISFGESSSQGHAGRTHIFGKGSPEILDSCLMSETYSNDRRLEGKNVLSDESSYLKTQNIPAGPQSLFGNNCNDIIFGHGNVCENGAHFSTNRTGLPFGQNIFPHSGDNDGTFDRDNVSPESDPPIYSSPRKTNSNISSTPPRTENLFPSCGTPPYFSPLQTAQSPQRPQQMMSPRTPSPASFVNSSSGASFGTATSENADENCYSRTIHRTLNFDDSRFFAQNNLSTSQPPNLKDSQHGTPLGSVRIAKPKTVLKTSKKTTALKKRHSASCPKYKEVGSNLLRAESKVSVRPADLKSIKITLQNDPAKDVKPASVGPFVEVSQIDVMDTEESDFQCSVPEDVFQKIVNFLKSKVMVKRKDLSPQQQERHALSLARAFIRANTVGALDKRTMKILNDFSGECIG